MPVIDLQRADPNQLLTVTKNVHALSSSRTWKSTIELCPAAASRVLEQVGYRGLQAPSMHLGKFSIQVFFSTIQVFFSTFTWPMTGSSR